MSGPFSAGDRVRLVDARPHGKKKPPFPLDAPLTVGRVAGNGFIGIVGQVGFWDHKRFEGAS